MPVSLPRSAAALLTACAILPLAACGDRDEPKGPLDPKASVLADPAPATAAPPAGEAARTAPDH